MIDLHHHVLPSPDVLAQEDVRAAGVAWEAASPDSADSPGTLVLEEGLRLPCPTALVDDAVRLTAMDADGVEVSLLSPPPHLYATWRSPDEQAGLHRTVNDDTVARARRRPDRLAAAVLLPWGDVDAALAELDRVDGGAEAVVAPPSIDGVALTAGGRRAVLDAVAALGLLLVLHPYVPIERASDPLVGSVGFVQQTGDGLVRLAADGGLPAGLRVLACHGGGTLPWLLDRVEHARRLADPSAPPLLDLLAGLHVDLLTHGQGPTELVLRQLGADRVVVGSDAPFVVGEPLAAQLDRLPPHGREAAAVTTPRRLLARSGPAAQLSSNA